MADTQSVEETPKPAEHDPKLLAVLTQKQKKALGLLPEKYQSEKAKARNQMLSERMRKINEERKAQAKKAVKGVVEPPKKRKAKKVESEEEEETSSEDQVIQKRAAKVDRTIQHLSRVEERLQSLQSSQNPYMRLLFR